MFNSSGTSQDRLKHFLKDVEEFLDDIIRGRSFYIYDALLAPLRAAWDSVRPRFDDVISEIDNVPDDKLDDHGLLNPKDLNFKL